MSRQPGTSQLVDRMRKPNLLMVLVVAGLCCMISCRAANPHMECKVDIPLEYKITPFDPPPNGEPESIRYQKAYEAFWWNCVLVKARNLDGRCPFVCSGTPAADAGCSAGAVDAENKICDLAKRYGCDAVRAYLKILAQEPEAGKKMRPYFSEPTEENIPKQ